MIKLQKVLHNEYLSTMKLIVQLFDGSLREKRVCSQNIKLKYLLHKEVIDDNVVEYHNLIVVMS